ncbi:MFS general substrate transporter [Aureobasidium pullulans]|uniref:MFS general substrate transporter n=1 Tax=Aureobasidium pullulans TaxID=5580 RepID=A0AB74JHA9_AURPU|nr:MFS general substrate transporter [Aureobasidium pullulans]THX50101.1 MFS general substrate transporter [Aureobasidium pullulans]
MTSAVDHAKAAMIAEHMELPEKGVLPEQQQHSNGDLQLINTIGEIRRIPIPSSDPNDPLNYSKWRKLGILVCCCWFSIFSLVLVGGLGPILGVFIGLYAPTGRTVQEVVNLTTYPSLVMAFVVLGSFLILPLSMMFGRRPIFLGCCVLLLGSTLGAGASNSYNTHMACRILQGVAAGATESVLPLIITDMSFVDERGLWFGVYWGSQNLINTIFGISASYLVAVTSWRYFYWVLAIFAAGGLVTGFFLLAETRYTRSPASMDGQVIFTDEWGVTHFLTDAEARARLGDVHQPDDQEYREKTYLQHLNPVSGTAPNALKLGLGANVKMLQACSSPGVIYAILASSIALGVGIAMSLVYASILTTSFHWSEKSIGLVNVGIFPASLAAMFYAGYCGDKMNIWLAKRRNGVHLPEDTLVQLILPFFVGAIGIIIFAVTANAPESHSSWGIIMGWTLYEFAFIVVLITTTHFGSEAFPKNPGPALVVVIGVKNIVSFGASFGIVPMVHAFNYLTAFMILFGIYVGIFLLGIPVYFFNPKWRAYMAREK